MLVILNLFFKKENFNFFLISILLQSCEFLENEDLEDVDEGIGECAEGGKEVERENKNVFVDDFSEISDSSVEKVWVIVEQV